MLAQIKTWQRRLESLLPGSLGSILADSLRPLRPLAAQLLWLGQPGFALFGRSAEIGALAELLAGDSYPSDPSSDIENR